jgi:predicted nucleic acid-binding protein
MIKVLKDGKTLSITGKDYKLIAAYAKEHKLTFRDVVYLALINAIAKEEGIK